jgi:hypothetical protein
MSDATHAAHAAAPVADLRGLVRIPENRAEPRKTGQKPAIAPARQNPSSRGHTITPGGLFSWLCVDLSGSLPPALAGADHQQRLTGGRAATTRRIADSDDEDTGEDD